MMIEQMTTKLQSKHLEFPQNSNHETMEERDKPIKRHSSENIEKKYLQVQQILELAN